MAGHRGLVGSALVRGLLRSGCQPIMRTREELDLTNSAAVLAFFRAERPSVVFLAAARVGGIAANARMPWTFLYENLMIESTVLGAALESGIRRVVFFGSSCVYPRLAPQPIKEEYLLSGPLEPSNEPYAIAKIAGLKLVDAANRERGTAWVSLMPTNLYGPGDNFDLESSHVLPAMLRKFHEAQGRLASGPSGYVTLWGSGSPRREFLHVDDLAEAALCVAASDMTGLVNVGYGSDVSIAELAGIVARTVGYTGDVHWDRCRPDGTPRKLLDSTRIRSLGWRPTTSLEEGIARTYADFSRGVSVTRTAAS